MMMLHHQCLGWGPLPRAAKVQLAPATAIKDTTTLQYHSRLLNRVQNRQRRQNYTNCKRQEMDLIMVYSVEHVDRALQGFSKLVVQGPWHKRRDRQPHSPQQWKYSLHLWRQSKKVLPCNINRGYYWIMCKTSRQDNLLTSRDGPYQGIQGGTRGTLPGRPFLAES